MAFASQPLMKYYSPTSLLNVGSAFTVVAVGFAVLRGHVQELGKPDGKPHPNGLVANTTIGTIAALTIAVIIFMMATSSATKDSRANDARCLAIQQDMLAAEPKRTDGPDLFQALACRPQGEGSVFAKPRTPALPHRAGD